MSFIGHSHRQLRNPSSFINPNAKKEKRATEHTLDCVRVHEDYNYATLNHDIALLTLREPIVPPNEKDDVVSPVTWNEDVKPICLPHKSYHPDLSHGNGKKITISGWGANGEDSNVEGKPTFPRELQTADLDYLSTSECIKDVPLPATHMCTGGVFNEEGEWINADSGDSGGEA